MCLYKKGVKNEKNCINIKFLVVSLSAEVEEVSSNGVVAVYEKAKIYVSKKMKQCEIKKEIEKESTDLDVNETEYLNLISDVVSQKVIWNSRNKVFLKNNQIVYIVETKEILSISNNVNEFFMETRKNIGLN